LIAKRQIEIAKATGADAVAHGATGKGNDQVRFELTYYALNPDIKVIAPWREWDFKSRSDLIEFAEKHQIPVAKDKRGEAPVSVDANLLHSSSEGKVLEDPGQEPPPYVYQCTIEPEDAPDKATIISIGFSKGDPVSIDGKKLSPAALLTRLNELGRDNGIGRVDLVENRFVGMKSRGVYETPGGTILLAAHRAMESLTLDREAMHLKDSLMPRYAELIYYGFWFSPEREMLQALIDKRWLHRRGRGDAALQGQRHGGRPLEPRNRSASKIVTFEDDAGARHDQKDAEGFTAPARLPRLLGQTQHRVDMWPDTRLLGSVRHELPIVRADGERHRDDMAVAVANAGGLGPHAACPHRRQGDEGVAPSGLRTNRPINLNLFCHQPAAREATRAAWLKRLAPYYAELGAEMPQLPLKASNIVIAVHRFDLRRSNNWRPPCGASISGWPEPTPARVRAAGCTKSSARPLFCARRNFWRSRVSMPSCAQGAEAGGIAACSSRPRRHQIGTLALVHEIVNAGARAGDRCRAASSTAGHRGAHSRWRRRRSARHRLSRLPRGHDLSVHRAALAEPDRQTVITSALPSDVARRGGSSRASVREQVRSTRPSPIIRWPRPRSSRSAPRWKPKAPAISHCYGQVSLALPAATLGPAR
jgi:argininosuccinate synthase